MITAEVREWMEKVERGQYSYEDAMIEFACLSRYLTTEELKMLKTRLKESYSP